MRIVEKIGPHSYRTIRDDERDKLVRERDEARAETQRLRSAIEFALERASLGHNDGWERLREVLDSEGSHARS